MPSTRLSRIDFAMVLLLRTLLELLDPLSVDVADGPEDEDGDAGKREQAQKRQEHGPGDGVLGDGREEGYGAACPEKDDDCPCRTRAALLMTSLVVALIRTPRYSSKGGANRRSESIASWMALTSKVLVGPSVLGSSASGTANQNRSLRVA